MRNKNIISIESFCESNNYFQQSSNLNIEYIMFLAMLIISIVVVVAIALCWFFSNTRDSYLRRKSAMKILKKCRKEGVLDVLDYYSLKSDIKIGYGNVNTISNFLKEKQKETNEILGL